MGRLVNIVIAVLGFAVLCKSHPNGMIAGGFDEKGQMRRLYVRFLVTTKKPPTKLSKNQNAGLGTHTSANDISKLLVFDGVSDIGLQVNKRDKEPPPLVKKERQKRATNQQAARPAFEQQKRMTHRELFVQTLKSDPGFLANLEKVFATVFVRNTTYYEANSSTPDESGNQNNTGLDDRLQPKGVLHKRYKEMVITEKNPTAPPTPSLSNGSHTRVPVTPSYNISSDIGRVILAVFGTPSSLTTKYEPQEIKADDGHIGDSTGKSKLTSSQDGNSKSSSSTQKTLFYAHLFYSLIFILVVS